MNNLNNITSKFLIEGTVSDIKPLGNGLINDTYRIQTAENDRPDYVLQRINHHIFTDVDLLQHNVETVTNHIREQLKAEGADDIDRRVLRFVPTTDGKTYHFDGESYWRVSIFISDAVTMDAVTPESRTTQARRSATSRLDWLTSPTSWAKQSPTSTTCASDATSCARCTPKTQWDAPRA